jgi:hypothetical protein
MAIAADSKAGTGAPFVKFTGLGATFVGAFASAPFKCRRQQIKFGTTTLLWKDDGTTPLLEEVMHFVAMPGTTAGIGDRADLQVIEPGAHVRFAVGGYKWGQVIDARKALPATTSFREGEPCSGDVYTITLVGWSAETKNPDAAKKAGFTVVDGRIVLRSEEDKDKYVLAKSRQNENSNTAGDFEITIRRPGPDDKRWEQLADELYLTKPWEASIPADPGVNPYADHGANDDDQAPF